MAFLEESELPQPMLGGVVKELPFKLGLHSTPVAEDQGAECVGAGKGGGSHVPCPTWCFSVSSLLHRGCLPGAPGAAVLSPS